MSHSKDLLLSSVTHYFQQHNSHRKTLRTIVEGTSPVSLRVVDWFVTHYAKEKNVMYWISVDGKKWYETVPNDNIQVKKFQVSLEYRAMLKSFSKVHFDPFRRHDRVSFVIETHPQTTVIETTIGQLKFWQWALEYHVYDYIINHLTQIETSMASQNSSRRRKGGDNVDKVVSLQCHDVKTPRKTHMPQTTIYKMQNSCQVVFD